MNDRYIRSESSFKISGCKTSLDLHSCPKHGSEAAQRRCHVEKEGYLTQGVAT